jgi:hypothetical protein
VSTIKIIETPVIVGMAAEALEELVGLEVVVASPPSFIYAGCQDEPKSSVLEFSSARGYCVMVVKLTNACRQAGKHLAETELCKQFKLDDFVVFPAGICQRSTSH